MGGGCFNGRVKNTFAILSLIVSLAASVPYIIDTVKKKIQPERISWLLWSALSVTYFTSALMTDGAVLLMIGELIGPVIVFFLSLKYGVGGKSLFDRICLAVAVVAFILLLIIDQPIWGLFLALFVDLIGSILTIRKLLKDRSSESRLSWGLFVVAPALAIVALENYSIESLAFPVYAVVACSIIFFIIKPKKVSQKELKEIEKL